MSIAGHVAKQLKGSQLTCFYDLVLFDFSGPISCGEQLKGPGVHLGVVHGHFFSQASVKVGRQYPLPPQGALSQFPLKIKEVGGRRVC